MIARTALRSNRVVLIPVRQSDFEQGYPYDEEAALFCAGVLCGSKFFYPVRKLFK